MLPLMFDLRAELAGAIDNRDGCWGFIRSFAAAWATPLGEGDGCDAADLDAAERRLGLRLPAVLREAYALLGRRGDLTSNQDRLLAPEELYVDDTGQVLVYRLENQDVVEWGIPLDALARDDARTVYRTSMADNSAELWAPWLDRLSPAFVEIVLSETLIADEELFNFLDLTPDDIALVEATYERLAMPAYPADEPSIVWFAGPDVLLRQDAGACLMVRARTPEALDEVYETLDGEWNL
ncbi:hypothetical protein ACFXJ8_16100 [Nonomuraea sp. NPDC059194]|uniref:hypothetical protein n=1 Tax=Nonomuraea sp. NPDC059194 TaxID=3346764 RepID=UPI00369A231E